ncbi:hypothetical protein ANN_01279 [Periplaneta americana]|uniref:Uncharacterized protein n=1 Tax=Periplaneta americana TaxID=6978 RepID=A0ABQ8TU74_PERAM|nr:hypothetical protein ANN_01279 [Periplaneta americana]
MICVAETREDTAKTRQLFEIMEMNTLRRITGKTRRDRVRSKGIREECNIQGIEEWVRRREEYKSHASRMGDYRLARRVHLRENEELEDQEKDG